MDILGTKWSLDVVLLDWAEMGACGETLLRSHCGERCKKQDFLLFNQDTMTEKEMNWVEACGI